jgi:hypothetical protein
MEHGVTGLADGFCCSGTEQRFGRLIEMEDTRVGVEDDQRFGRDDRFEASQAHIVDFEAQEGRVQPRIR